MDWLSLYESIFGGVSRSGSIQVLAVFMAAVILVGLVLVNRSDSLMSPRMRFGRARRGAANDYALRLSTQFDYLRRGEGTARSRFNSRFYRDGDVRGEIEVNNPDGSANDFFTFVRVAATAMFLVLGLAVSIVTSLPAPAVIAVAGGVWLLVPWQARRYNGSRKRDIEIRLPDALSRISVRLAAEMSMEDAFAKTAQLMSGPISVELAWAAGRMRDQVNPLDVLIELDARNGTSIFGQISGQMRAARVSSGTKKANDLFASMVGRLNERELDRVRDQVKLVGRQMLRAMIPLLLPAIIIGAAGPWALTLIVGQ